MIEPAGVTGLIGAAPLESGESYAANKKKSDAHQARSAWRQHAGLTLTVTIPILVWFAPLGLNQPAQKSLAIAAFMITGWMTEALAYALTGFIGCYLFWALGVAEFNVAFGGFATDTPWFCFGALLLGMAATKTGLARRFAYVLLSRAGLGPSRVILGFTLVSLLLTLFVPSGAARVILMASVALGLVQAYGLGPGSNFGRALFVTLTYSAGLFDKMVIAGSSTILARGLIEQAGGVRILWSQWVVAFLPCTLLTVIVIWRLAILIFPPEKILPPGENTYLRNELSEMGRWGSGEIKSALLMLAALILWATDFWHHASPALIGLGVGLLAATPKIGVLESDDVKRVNYLPVFFIATATSMGSVLTQTKAIEVMTGFMFSWMKPLLTSGYLMALVPFWTGFFYHVLIGSNVSMLSTSIPPLMNFATSHGFNPATLGMIWTFAGGCKIFIYQSAVLMVGYSYGYFNGRDLFRFAVCLTLIESIILLLLVSLYWPMIGLG